MFYESPRVCHPSLIKRQPKMLSILLTLLAVAHHRFGRCIVGKISLLWDVQMAILRYSDVVLQHRKCIPRRSFTRIQGMYLASVPILDYDMQLHTVHISSALVFTHQ